MGITNLTIAGLQAHLRQTVARALAAVGAADAQVELTPPPDAAMGDVGFPCFALAKLLRRAPAQIAQDVAAHINPDDVIGAAEVDKAYVNLRLRPEALVRVVIDEAMTEGFGAGRADPQQHWMIEYSSPNTNKPLHLGHLRNNLLGSSVAALLRFCGHRVTRVNLVNDRGVHICKSMLAYQLWGEGVDPERAGIKGDRFVGDLYVTFEKRSAEEYAAWQQTPEATRKLAAWIETPAGRAAMETAGKAATAKGAPAEESAAKSAAAAPPPAHIFYTEYRDDYFNSESALGAQVRELLLRWERGDPETLALWRKMNGWVLAGFESSYERMGVAFEQVQLESETYKLGKQIVEEGLAAGHLLRRPDGAVVCDLAALGLQGEKVLLRGDGTSVYMTQDLGTAVERFDRHAPDQIVYVVGDEQNFHFEVLFKILGLLRPGLAERCSHLAYGMIRLPEGKMKSREGSVVDADDLMDEMHRLARAETRSRADEGKAHAEGLSDNELAYRAERIGMAALKYFLLKYSPRTSFEYDPKASIDFLGQTGPYCLFNYARTRSLLRKVGGEPPFDAKTVTRLGTEHELDIVRQLLSWPDVVLRAAHACDPSRIAEYLFDLCKRFAFIFTDKGNHPIATCEDEPLRAARLMLAAAVGNTVRIGLELLGIEILEEM